MTAEVRREIVLHAIRWANNILVEVANNQGKHLPKEAQGKLREALSNLHDVEMSARTGEW